MNEMRRVKRTDHEVVNGVEFKIDVLEEMEYTGQWSVVGHRVSFKDRVAYLYSYPFASYLRELLEGIR